MNRRFASNWMTRHVNDPWVRQSQKDGYRSRAAYKLIQMQDQHNLFKRFSKNILELGAAPGSWTQACLRIYEKNKWPRPQLVALDIQGIVDS